MVMENHPKFSPSVFPLLEDKEELSLSASYWWESEEGPEGEEGRPSVFKVLKKPMPPTSFSLSDPELDFEDRSQDSSAFAPVSQRNLREVHFTALVFSVVRPIFDWTRS